MSGRDQRPEAFYTETLTILEVDTNNRAAAQVVFDPDDVDAALAELDARYLAGEAGPHAHTWSLMTQICAAHNRREILPTMPDWVNVDHRRGIAFVPGDLIPYARATWDIAPDVQLRIVAVHRLTDLGVVTTQSGHGTSRNGVDAEWQEVGVYAFEGDLLSRTEIFDEADLDAALAQFDGLHPHARRLENAASKVDQRFWTCFTARDWDALAELMTHNISTYDRRRVVNSGVHYGRDHYMAEMRAAAEVGFEKTASTVLAVRGASLALTRVRAWADGMRPEEVSLDVLNIAEIDANNRIVAFLGFDVDDIDGAFAELDARYLAGEAAPYSQTWSAMTEVQAAYNCHQMPPMAEDSVDIDHRRGRAFAPGEGTRFIAASWGVAPNLKGHIESVHRLSNLGAVVTEVVTGTSQEGFDFEWREIGLFTFAGNLVCRAELFDEVDLDAALVRFDELCGKTQVR
jgi:hypothetical protein